MSVVDSAPTSPQIDEMEDFDGQHPSLSPVVASTHVGRHEAASYGLAFNENRGVYARGKPYDLTKKSHQGAGECTEYSISCKEVQCILGICPEGLAGDDG